MSTVANMLNMCRYDLRNYGDMAFDEDLVVEYLNRAINILDYRLTAMNSDQTLTQANATLTSGNNYATCPTGCIAVREVWISTDRKEQLEPHEIYYKRKFRSGESAEPNFWAHIQNQIEFEVNADATYTVVVDYDKFSTTLTKSTTNMPYNGTYDSLIREVTVQMVINKQLKKTSEPDAIYYQVFDQVLMMDMVNRNFKRKNYKLDF